jgi:hypothetical protein
MALRPSWAVGTAKPAFSVGLHQPDDVMVVVDDEYPLRHSDRSV